MQCMHAAKHELYSLTTQESEALRNRPEERYLFTAQVNNEMNPLPASALRSEWYGLHEGVERIRRLTRTPGFPYVWSCGHHR